MIQDPDDFPLSPDEGIGAPFMTNGRQGAMPGNEANLVAQRKEFLMNRVQKLPVIPAWKVGSTDGAAKENIPNLGQAILGVNEHDMSGGVPRTMQDIELLLAHADDIALLKPLVGLEITHRRKTEHLTLSGKRVNQKGIVGMRADNG